jgi:hypothetical protein
MTSLLDQPSVCEFLNYRAADLLKFVREFDDSFLLVFADHAQFGNDIRQLFDVLIFDHQINGILSQTLDDRSGHGKSPDSERVVL